MPDQYEQRMEVYKPKVEDLLRKFNEKLKTIRVRGNNLDVSLKSLGTQRINQHFDYMEKEIEIENKGTIPREYYLFQAFIYRRLAIAQNGGRDTEEGKRLLLEETENLLKKVSGDNADPEEILTDTMNYLLAELKKFSIYLESNVK